MIDYVKVLGWDDAAYSRWAKTLDDICAGAETLLDYGMDFDEAGDGLEEHWPDFINEVLVEIDDGNLEITIDPRVEP